MKNIITLFLISCIILQSNAQQVIGSAGKNLSTSSASVNFTLGEAFVKEYYTSSTNLNTGFHQNFVEDTCNISLAITTSNSACGMATGTATVVATGGNSPYAYQWTSGDNTSIADSLSAGIYTVLVTDALGCTKSSVTSINDVGAPVITVTSVTNVSCNGGSNGAISISVTGGSSPYTYFWVNGATTQNVSNLSSAPYQIQVIDANGCQSSKTIIVNEPSPISLYVNTSNASCGNADGSTTVIASGGNGGYSFQWSNSATTSSVTGLSAGNYSVTVTDNKGCFASAQASIINTGGASVTLDSIISAGCSNGTGSIYVSVNGGIPPYTYAWSNGATTQDLIGVPAGMYGLVITGSNGCIGAFTGTIQSQQPFLPSICMVDVDTTTLTNRVIFEKDSIANTGIAQYKIYRETTTLGVYILVGTVPANQLSEWTDPSANPQQKAWRYKISSVDTCGTESVQSTFHKTIHLVCNIGLSNVVNLMWDNYEGFNYGTYIIYRYTPSTGWDSLDAVAGSPSITYNSYTDLSPPTLANLYYFITIQHPTGCTPTVIKNPVPMASTVNNTKSNTYKINPTAVNKILFNETVNIYPNPSLGQFRILSAGFRMQSIVIYNIYGDKILNEVINDSSYTTSFISPNGIYIVNIKTEKGMIVKKVVITD